MASAGSVSSEKYYFTEDEKVRIRDGWKYYPDGVKLGPMPQNGVTKSIPAATTS